MNFMKKFKKALSMMLALILVATLLPMPARAAADSSEAITVPVNNRNCKKVSQFISGNHYVVVVFYARKYYAMVHTGDRVSAVQVSISNGKVTSEVTDGMLWYYCGGKLSYEHDGETYYLYSGPSQSWWNDGLGNMPLEVTTTHNSPVSLSGTVLSVGAYNLCYKDGTIKGSTSKGQCYIYQEIIG